MHSTSIDVVIPSFRMDERYLVKIFDLAKPADFNFEIYLISDNPSAIPSPKIMEYVRRGEVNLIINEKNLGVSETRNKGIEIGKSKWVLLMDDDIDPDENLYFVFADGIRNDPDALGFIGHTGFPKPFNHVTSGISYYNSGAYTAVFHAKEHIWFPTANIVLNKELLGERRFLRELTRGGEDIEFFSRNCIENNKKYTCMPTAAVTHPWWDNGKSQIKRMFNYGWGASDILGAKHLQQYIFRDFTNTSETIFLLLVGGLIAVLFGFNPTLFFLYVGVVLLAEFITVIIRVKKNNHAISIPIAVQFFLHKNAFEAGAFWGAISKGRIVDLGKRLDTSFGKHRSFGLNRWKIIKLSILVITALALFIFFK